MTIKKNTIIIEQGKNISEHKISLEYGDYLRFSVDIVNKSKSMDPVTKMMLEPLLPVYAINFYKQTSSMVIEDLKYGKNSSEIKCIRINN